MSETNRPDGNRFRDALVIINSGACIRAVSHCRLLTDS
jgi:hypothetical protein